MELDFISKPVSSAELLEKFKAKKELNSVIIANINKLIDLSKTGIKYSSIRLFILYTEVECLKNLGVNSNHSKLDSKKLPNIMEEIERKNSTKKLQETKYKDIKYTKQIKKDKLSQKSSI